MIGTVEPRQAVQLLRLKEHRLAAMRELLGGVNASELRQVQVTDAVRDALLAGAMDPHPQVRWWSIQLLDHLPDPAVLPALCEALDDAVPRVRRNAAHALGCMTCKPSWDGALPATAVARLAQMATSDPNAKVRSEASLALAACRDRATPP